MKRPAKGILGAVVLVLVSTASAFAQSAATPARKGPVPPAGQPDFSEVNWILNGGGPTEFSEWVLTPGGKGRFDAYDFKTDDPAYTCTASSWTRVWLNPNVLVHITQGPDFVRLQHEFMDIDRNIPLSSPLDPDPKRVRIPGHPALGASTAWYEGAVLVIDTIDVAASYVSTIAERAGMPQSPRMHTVERLLREGDRLVIETTYLDAANYRSPFVSTIRYLKTDWDLMAYGCIPEEAAVTSPR
jgi:hypothetical protein